MRPDRPLTRLASCRDPGPPAVPALIDVLDQSDEESARWEAVGALRLIGGGEHPEVRRQVVSALSTTLRKDDGPRIRAEAAQAIGFIGAIGVPAVDDAIPVLLEAMEDGDADVRAAVAGAIGRIERPFPADAFQKLLESARDQEADVRAAVAGAIARLGPPADAVTVLAGMLKDPKVSVRRAALRGLADIGPEARDVLADVKVALKSTNRRERILAADAVWKIDAQSALALPVLIDVLEDRKTPDRYHQDLRHAIGILGDMGPAARPAVPVLLGVLETAPPRGVVSSIRRAIEQIDPAMLAEESPVSLPPASTARGLILLIGASIDDVAPCEEHPRRRSALRQPL